MTMTGRQFCVDCNCSKRFDWRKNDDKFITIHNYANSSCSKRLFALLRQAKFHTNWASRNVAASHSNAHWLTTSHADQGRWQKSDRWGRSTQTASILTAVVSGTLIANDQKTNDLADNDSKYSTLFPRPLVVKCADYFRSAFAVDRQSAIKSLDIVADVAQDSQPAVVSITSSGKSLLSRSSTGSGFIVDDQGHVITNAHVVGHRGEVRINMSDGRSFSGRVLAVDMSSDLAYIKLDVNPKLAQSLPHLPLATDFRKIRPGSFVLALGSPLMLANSVTVGVVSAVDRDLGHSEGIKYIQTDALITFGNSGGPLVNLYGEVIGVNTMIAGIGVGFAIPVEQIRNFIDVASKSIDQSQPNPCNRHILKAPSSGPPTSRRYLGLIMRTLTPELIFEMASRGLFYDFEISEGVMIHAVLQNSPAQRSGLKAGDIIVAIDNTPITNAQQVYTATESRESLTITVVRQGQKVTLKNVQTEKT